MIDVEKDFKFLEKHFEKNIEICCCFEDLIWNKKKIWINDKDYISIDKKKNIIKLESKIKDALLLYSILHLFKTNNDVSCSYEDFYFKINKEKIKYSNENYKKNAKDFIKKINNLNYIEIELELNEKDLECEIWFESADYEDEYLKNKED